MDTDYFDADFEPDYFTDADCIPEPFDEDVPDFDPYDEGWYTDAELDAAEQVDERERDEPDLIWDEYDMCHQAL